MLRVRFIIGMLCVLYGLQAAGQTSNPFELKWKSGGSPHTETTDAPEVSIPLAEEADVTMANEIEEPRATVDSADVINVPAPDRVLSDPAFDSTASTIRRNVDSSIMIDKMARVDAGNTPPGEESPTSEQPAAQELEPAENIPDPILPGPTRNVGVLLIITMLGLSVLVLTWAVNANRGFIQKIYRAAMNENLSALLLREQKFASLQYLYYIVYATFFINGSLFLFLISRYSHWGLGNGTTPLLLFVGILVGIYLTRHIFMRLLGSTFGISNETTHYNFNILLYNILAGIALIPINLFLAFGPEAVRMPMIYGGLGLLVLLYLIRQLRGVNIASHIISTNVFQFFVYLCAVEILPVLVLFKYFITD